MDSNLNHPILDSTIDCVDENFLVVEVSDEEFISAIGSDNEETNSNYGTKSKPNDSDDDDSEESGIHSEERNILPQNANVPFETSGNNESNSTFEIPCSDNSSIDSNGDTSDSSELIVSASSDSENEDIFEDPSDVEDSSDIEDSDVDSSSDSNSDQVYTYSNMDENEDSDEIIDSGTESSDWSAYENVAATDSEEEDGNHFAESLEQNPNPHDRSTIVISDPEEDELGVSNLSGDHKAEYTKHSDDDEQMSGGEMSNSDNDSRASDDNNLQSDTGIINESKDELGSPFSVDSINSNTSKASDEHLSPHSGGSPNSVVHSPRTPQSMLDATASPSSNDPNLTVLSISDDSNDSLGQHSTGAELADSPRSMTAFSPRSQSSGKSVEFNSDSPHSQISQKSVDSEGSPRFNLEEGSSLSQSNIVSPLSTHSQQQDSPGPSKATTGLSFGAQDDHEYFSTTLTSIECDDSKVLCVGSPESNGSKTTVSDDTERSHSNESDGSPSSPDYGKRIKIACEAVSSPQSNESKLSVSEQAGSPQSQMSCSITSDDVDSCDDDVVHKNVTYDKLYTESTFLSEDSSEENNEADGANGTLGINELEADDEDSLASEHNLNTDDWTDMESDGDSSALEESDGWESSGESSEDADEGKKLIWNSNKKYKHIDVSPLDSWEDTESEFSESSVSDGESKVKVDTAANNNTMSGEALFALTDDSDNWEDIESETDSSDDNVMEPEILDSAIKQIDDSLRNKTQDDEENQPSTSASFYKKNEGTDEMNESSEDGWVYLNNNDGVDDNNNTEEESENGRSSDGEGNEGSEGEMLLDHLTEQPELQRSVSEVLLDMEMEGGRTEIKNMMKTYKPTLKSVEDFAQLKMEEYLLSKGYVNGNINDEKKKTIDIKDLENLVNNQENLLNAISFGADYEPNEVQHGIAKFLDFYHDLVNTHPDLANELNPMLVPMMIHFQVELISRNLNSVASALFDSYGAKFMDHCNDEEYLAELKMISDNKDPTELEFTNTLKSLQTRKYKFELSPDTHEKLAKFLAGSEIPVLISLFSGAFNTQLKFPEIKKVEEEVIEEFDEDEESANLDSDKIIPFEDIIENDLKPVSYAEEVIRRVRKNPFANRPSLTVYSTNGNPLCGAMSAQGTLAAYGMQPAGIRLCKTSKAHVLHDNEDNFDEVVDSEKQSQSIQNINAHEGSVYGLAFHPKTKLMFSVGLDGYMRAWDLHKEKPAHRCVYGGHVGPIWSIDISPTGTMIVTGGVDTTARLWLPEKHEYVRLFVGHYFDVDCVKFHPNEAYVATGSVDKTVRLWSVGDGNMARILTGCPGAVKALAFHESGKYIAGGGEDDIIRIWDIAEGDLLCELPSASFCKDLSFNGNHLAACFNGSIVQVWDLKQIVGGDEVELKFEEHQMRFYEEFGEKSPEPPSATTIPAPFTISCNTEYLFKLYFKDSANIFCLGADLKPIVVDETEELPSQEDETGQESGEGDISNEHSANKVSSHSEPEIGSTQASPSGETTPSSPEAAPSTPPTLTEYPFTGLSDAERFAGIVSLSPGEHLEESHAAGDAPNAMSADEIDTTENDNTRAETASYDKLVVGRGDDDTWLSDL